MYKTLSLHPSCNFKICISKDKGTQKFAKCYFEVSFEAFVGRYISVMDMCYRTAFNGANFGIVGKYSVFLCPTYVSAFDKTMSTCSTSVNTKDIADKVDMNILRYY